MSIDYAVRRTVNHSTMGDEEVPLSRWINQRLPAWNEILTSHDVARLTRRPRWLVNALSLVGGFPKKQLFRGQPIGWLRADVEEWLADCCPAQRGFARCRRRRLRLGCSTALRGRHGYCRNFR